MIVKAIKTPIFKEGQDLSEFLFKNLTKIKDEDVVVITSKIVALSEGRVVLKVDEKAREKLIRSESQYAMKTKYGWLAIRDGMVMAGAGIDESNADGKIVLLPKDSFKSAMNIRKVLMKRYGLKKLAVLITDSRLLPLRAGIVGVALGYAGFKGLWRHKGRADIFGRLIKSSRTDIADSLAAIVNLDQGEGDESRPIAVIKGAPLNFTNEPNANELLIDISDDRYQPLFENIKKIRLKKGDRHFKV